MGRGSGLITAARATSASSSCIARRSPGWQPRTWTAWGGESLTTIRLSSRWTRTDRIVQSICPNCWRAWAVLTSLTSSLVHAGCLAVALNGWSAKRVALSKAGNYYVRLCLGTPVRDATAGLRVHRSAFLAQHNVLGRVSTTGFGFQVEMTELERSLGAVIAEVPITFDERMAGESKLDSSIFVEELAMVTKRRPEPSGSGRAYTISQGLALAVGPLRTQAPFAVSCELFVQDNFKLFD